MDAPFEIGDVVYCVQERLPYVRRDEPYVVEYVRQDDDDNEFYIRVVGRMGTHRATRFELANGCTPMSPVIRKIKQLETRFQQRVAR